MSHEDRLDEIEKEKYEQVWSHPQYRQWSPGADEHATAFDMFQQATIYKPEDKTTVCDYGCGEGWSVQFFNDQGYKAWGVEHAKNAVRAAGILVYEECLWKMSHLPDSDHAFCCDVMEHIPPHKVNLVLSQIASKTRNQAYFRIAFVDDNFGPTLLKKPLHLTVEKTKFWIFTLNRHWGYVKPLVQRSGYGTFICADPISRRDELENTPMESA